MKIPTCFNYKSMTSYIYTDAPVIGTTVHTHHVVYIYIRITPDYELWSTESATHHQVFCFSVWWKISIIKTKKCWFGIKSLNISYSSEVILTATKSLQQRLYFSLLFPPLWLIITLERMVFTSRWERVLYVNGSLRTEVRLAILWGFLGDSVHTIFCPWYHLFKI